MLGFTENSRKELRRPNLRNDAVPSESSRIGQAWGGPSFGMQRGVDRLDVASARGETGWAEASPERGGLGRGMNSNIDDYVDALFEQAAKLDPAERATFLEEECGNDTELRAEVESLLEHDVQDTGAFMRTPGSDHASNLPVRSPSAERLVGRRVASYSIKAVVGSGGMGTVYAAEQERPQRTIALKVMHAGIVSQDSLRRFEHEAQVLARLRHPNIAQVYEAGSFADESADGLTLPFFAMEYIPDARSITQFARTQELSISERLRIFAQACDAIHHGHQKGIIHRDIKPGNLLVDAERQLKIIDFGVARSTNSDVAVTTMRTDVGQIIGTLQYMSPEQCAADPLGLDTRSDVYSLGVVLYELLVERVPYDISDRSIHAAARVICEHASDRPSKYDRKLRGDVEIILLKALEKERERRYASAADLSQDIHRFLRREPIEAKPPTPWTRMSRWAIGHPVGSSAILASLVAVLIIALVPTAATWLRSREPFGIEVSAIGNEARLISYTGAELHVWPWPIVGANRRGIRPVDFIRHQGKRLVLLGFDSKAEGPLANKLCAFDVNDQWSTPVWCSEFEDAHIPPSSRVGFSARDFVIAHFQVLDVFSEIEGPEIVAEFSHTQSWRAIRVYGLDGQMHYQVWHDGSCTSFYWMSGPGLLVVAGDNAECYWERRGALGLRNAHPFVVFALRPQIGHISAELLDVYCRGADGCPEWYKSIGPPRYSDLLESPWLEVPALLSIDRKTHCDIKFSLARDSPNGPTWCVNSRGEIAHPDVLANDDLRRFAEPHDFFEFSLEELWPCGTAPPSARDRPSGIRDPESAGSSNPAARHRE